MRGVSAAELEVRKNCAAFFFSFVCVPNTVIQSDVAYVFIPLKSIRWHPGYFPARIFPVARFFFNWVFCGTPPSVRVDGSMTQAGVMLVSWLESAYPGRALGAYGILFVVLRIVVIVYVASSCLLWQLR